MNNTSIVEALSQIAREKNVDRDLVVQTLADALISAAKKRYGNTENYEVEIDPTTGRMDVFARRAVVKEVDEPGLEIALEDAQAIDDQAQLGSVVRERLDFADFGRNAIQTAKQILIQRVREAERERIYEEFNGRVDQIESGTVQQISHGDIILNLGRAEAAIPYKDQIRRERYRQGDAIRGYIYEVLKASRGPQVLLSRTHPEFLKKLFSLEVPEIAEDIVEIHAVAREPGERAKIAVSSNDERVDPVGACVGVKGSRVQSIVRELSGERIDIVPWSEEPEVFISRSLSPATVSRVIIDRRRQRATVLVEEDQLSLAIGKSGQNSRLAVQLTGWGLDIITEEEYQNRRVRIEANQEVFRRIPGVSELIAVSLATSGFNTIKEIAEITTPVLQTVPGLEEETFASQIREAAEAYVAEHEDEPGVLTSVVLEVETEEEVEEGTTVSEPEAEETEVGEEGEEATLVVEGETDEAEERATRAESTEAEETGEVAGSQVVITDETGTEQGSAEDDVEGVEEKAEEIPSDPDGESQVGEGHEATEGEISSS